TVVRPNGCDAVSVDSRDKVNLLNVLAFLAGYVPVRHLELKQAVFLLSLPLFVVGRDDGTASWLKPKEDEPATAVAIAIVCGGEFGREGNLVVFTAVASVELGRSIRLVDRPRVALNCQPDIKGDRHNVVVELRLRQLAELADARDASVPAPACFANFL